MNDCSSPALPRPIPLVRPPLQRLADGWQALKLWWSERARQRREAREIEIAADLNDAMLRDIGAPDWLLAQAEARRQARQQRLHEARLGLEHRPLGDRW
jgi:hypothetical protein